MPPAQALDFTPANGCEYFSVLARAMRPRAHHSLGSVTGHVPARYRLPNASGLDHYVLRMAPLHWYWVIAPLAARQCLHVAHFCCARSIHVARGRLVHGGLHASKPGLLLALAAVCARPCWYSDTRGIDMSASKGALVSWFDKTRSARWRHLHFGDLTHACDPCVSALAVSSGRRSGAPPIADIQGD